MLTKRVTEEINNKTGVDVMKYAGMPGAMWLVFSKSFEKQLNIVFGYNTLTAKDIMKKAKPKYKKIIAEIPEFEKADRFKTNIVNAAMLGAIILNMPKRPDVKRLTKYYADSMMTPMMNTFAV